MKYTIKEGKHFCNFTIDKLQPFATKRVGTFKLDTDCWYKATEAQPAGWNKLVGITEISIPFTDTGIHWNSGRLVYQALPEYGWFKIAWYVYSGGVRKEKEIGRFKAGHEYDFMVCHTGLVWRFLFDEETYLVEGETPRWSTLKCYPYFGGRARSPRTSHITIKYE